MTIKDLKIIESLKKVRPKDLVYSGILVFFMIIVGVLFFISTRFISQNINKVFSYEGAESIQVLDLPHYMLVAKKLGITTNTTPGNTEVPVAITPSREAPEIPTLPTETSETTATLNKQTLTIEVRNSTTKKGVAGILAKSLKEAGFSAPTTRNENTPYIKTTILVKESKYDYAALLLEEVIKSYPGAIAATTTESAPFDATIIIGTE
ncbi:MAG: hypothetical protein A2481_02220 [Candidatus Yonathbacteria bacterium RIFOXYC2_FULL_47_9]|nr:MAG: hypothetical protein A2481_02220 [Candidatus Yonathbacteria bacterium RIFOXYC2_FULL_47_9]HAT68627.1 hypothetical protein [Candidatus Yonathbacteria bacterium]